MTKKKGFLLILAVSISMLTIAACSTSDSTSEQSGTGEVKRVNIGAAGTDGGFYILSAAWASQIENAHSYFDITVETGGSLKNMSGLRDGEIEIGLALNDTAYSAYKGNGKFDGDAVEELRSLFALFPSVAHVVTRQDSGLESIEDLAGANIGVGTPGSASGLIAADMFRAHGVAEDEWNALHLNFSESLDGMRDGSVDAAYWLTVVPNGTLTAFSSDIPVNLIDNHPLDDPEFAKANPSVIEYTIPSGVYAGQDQDVSTHAIMGTAFTTKNSLTKDEAYDIVSAVWENYEGWKDAHSVSSEVTLETALDGMREIPLHAGAIKYYKEQGMEIPENLIPPEAQ
jgi:TRAP transporter TAXI family solute receptor